MLSLKIIPRIIWGKKTFLGKRMEKKRGISEWIIVLNVNWNIFFSSLYESWDSILILIISLSCKTVAFIHFSVTTHMNGIFWDRITYGKGRSSGRRVLNVILGLIKKEFRVRLTDFDRNCLYILQYVKIQKQFHIPQFPERKFNFLNFFQNPSKPYITKKSHLYSN